MECSEFGGQKELTTTLTVVSVGGVKLCYAYSASRIISLARGFKAQGAVKVTAGRFMVGAGSYLIAKT